MKIRFLILSFVMAMAFGLSLFAQSVPQQISYQGRLTDDAGNPVDGDTVDMSFAIFGASSGGTALWSEVQVDVLITGGIYSVELGDSSSLPGALFSAPGRWLEVAVDGETLTPRQEMVSVAYAFVAEALTSDRYVLNSGDTINGNLDVNGVLRIGPQAADSVGILFSSTNSPDYGAIIFGRQIGVYAVNNGTSVPSVGGLGMWGSGVYGQSGNTLAASTQVGGNFSATSANNALGVSTGATGHGSNPARAAMGMASNLAGGEATGGYFLAMAQGTGTHYGVMGRTLDVVGRHYGVYGQVSSPDGYGLYSVGNARVEGALGVDGVAQDMRTKKQIAMLKWYEANENCVITLWPEPFFAAAFDGWGFVYMSRPANDEYMDVYIKDGYMGSGPVPTLGSIPRGVAHDGRNMWVANEGSGNIAYFGQWGSSSLAVGTAPVGICYGGRYLWVANSGSNNVSVVDPVVPAVVQTVPAGSAPYWTACTVDNVWVTNSGDGTVTKIRKSDGANIGTFAVGGSPRGMAFDGINIWVANGTDLIVKLRESDGANLGSFGTAGLSSFGVVFDGANIWVTDDVSDIITKIRAIDGSIIGNYVTCMAPRMPAFDGVSIWVPCEGGGYQKF
jgi:YVTN family beta-propeller protein